MQGKHEPAAYI